jgi:dipeptidyl aminopeptidase/acylaminoacyl peptidase
MLILAGLMAPAPAASAQEPFTLEKIISSPFPSTLAAAPRGNTVAWVFNAEGKRNIWLAAAPAWRARRVTNFTQDDGQEIGALEFSPDSQTIVYVFGGPKNDAGEVPNPTSDPDGASQAVWTVNIAGGGPRRIDAGNSPAISPRGGWVAYVKDSQIWLGALDGSSKPRQVVVRGRNSSPVWSPDGRLLAFVSNRTTHSLIAVYDVAKRTVRYIAPSVDRDGTPRWSPDGKSIAFVRMPARIPGEPLFDQERPNPWSIWVADVASGEARQVWRSSESPEGSVPRMAGDALLQWAADGRLVFTSEQDGWQHLYSMPATGGEPVLLTPGECEYEQMTFTPDRREIFYSSNCGDIDRRHIWRVAVTGGAPQQVTTGDGIEWAPVVTSNSRWVAYLASTARQPAMPFVRPLGTGDARMLAAQTLPKDFPSDKLIVPQQVIFNAPDGLPIHNQLFLPASCTAAAKCPAVIFMHGGPMRHMMLGWHNRGYYHRAYALNQYLASRGYVVLAVNYRSGIGYGRAFREAKDRGVRGASEYQDIYGAGLYLKSRPDVDGARIGLWGGSYGGYLTALGLARNSDLFAAGVDLHGVHNRTTGRSGAGGNPEARRLAWQSSPVADVEKWRSPVLLIHGDDDRNVDFAQTVELVARLRQQGVTFEQIVYPDDVHDFLLHRHWLEVYRAAAAFFDKHLKSAR